MIEDKSMRSLPKASKSRSAIEDRPAGSGEKETESGLIYGRWYAGVAQSCGCDGVPEGIHVPGCQMGLCTSKYAESEPEEDADTEQEGG